MPDERSKKANELVSRLLNLSEDERSAFLDRECAGDDALRSNVDRLLRRVLSESFLPTGGGVLALDAMADTRKPALDLPAVFAGRYHVTREIGRGGMGIVVEARDETLHRNVAIKALGEGPTDEQSQRFLREARSAAALNHPNIVAIHDVGQQDEIPFLVMELVDGQTLGSIPPRDLGEVVRVASQICDALDHAHSRGLVHRDLKPSNVLWTAERQAIKLADMGIAFSRSSARITKTGAVAGTPAFMAPEQALGQRVDGRADLYSLGVMLYLWLTGRCPFEGSDALNVISQHLHAPVVPPTRFAPDIPASLEQLVLRLLSKNPDERLATPAEVKRALEVPADESGEIAIGSAIAGLARGRLVGRASELDELQSAWRSLGHGPVTMALIAGEPGVGKTRLANELIAAARLDGAVVLSGSCYENEATTPYLPFVEALRRVVRDSSDELLRDALGDSAAEISRLAPEVESRFGSTSARSELPPQEERLRLFDHVARFLQRLADGRPLLFFVDDMQWADQGTLALLHSLLRHAREERLFVLGTYRDAEVDGPHPLARQMVTWNRERLVTEVKLERLSAESTGTMLSVLLGDEQLDRSLVESLFKETEGNPFFLEEIVKSLIADERLVRTGNAWKRAQTDELSLPNSLKAAIGGRLERTSDGCRDVLRSCAVLGKAFDFGELSSVTGRDEDALFDLLDEAIAAQLIAPLEGESFAFTHDKIREVLYEELNPIRRRRMHARIAQGLQQLADSGRSVPIEELAHHYVAGGDYERGIDFARKAAESALSVFAWSEAIEMFDKAAHCAEELDRTQDLAEILGKKANAVSYFGDMQRACELYERALTLTDDPVHRCLLHSKAAENYVVSGDLRGHEHVSAALEKLDADEHPRIAAEALRTKGRYLHLEGRLDEATEIYNASLELAEPLGPSDLLINLYSYLAGTAQHQARFDVSDAWAQKCFRLGEENGLPLGTMLGLEFLGENASYCGRWSECVKHLEREFDLAREARFGDRVAWSHYRAYGLYPLGRVAEAEQVMRDGIELTKATGDRRLELYLTMGLGACRADLGRAEEGLELAQAVVREADEGQLSSHQICGRGNVSYVLLKLDRPDEAAAVAEEGVTLWFEQNTHGNGLYYGATFAEALLRGGKLELARRVLDEHRRLAEECDADVRIGQNLYAASLAAQTESTERAEALLDEAATLFEEYESPLDQLRVLTRRAKIARARGDEKKATTDEQAAAKIRTACGIPE